MSASEAKSNWFMERFVPFAKWWFDLLRSFFVVALLSYVAHKTNNGYLKALSGFSIFVFCTYVIVYLGTLFDDQFRAAWSVKNKYARWLALAVLILALSYGSYRWIEVIYSAFEDVIKYQIR